MARGGRAADFTRSAYAEALTIRSGPLRATSGLDQPLILYRFLGNFGPYTGARFGGTLTWADAADPPSFRRASQSLWPGTRTVNPKNLPGRRKCHEKRENRRLEAAS